MSNSANCVICGWRGKVEDTLIGPVEANYRWLCCPKCNAKVDGDDNLPILYPKELREAK